MPGDGVCALLEELGASAVVGAAEDEVDFWEALGCAGGLVDVVAAEVAGVFDGILDWEGSEVLVTEGWRWRAWLVAGVQVGSRWCLLDVSRHLPTTRRWATYKASWSLPALESLLNCTPLISEPINGVMSSTSAWPLGSRSGNVASASLP